MDAPLNPARAFVKQGRRLRRLLNALIADLAKPPQPQRLRQRRILYRKKLSDGDLVLLVEVVGVDVQRTIDKLVQPDWSLAAVAP